MGGMGWAKSSWSSKKQLGTNKSLQRRVEGAQTEDGMGFEGGEKKALFFWMSNLEYAADVRINKSSNKTTKQHGPARPTA